MSRILIVDDQPGMRMTLGGILKRRGYEVRTSEDGLQALEEVKKSKFDLVFMDIKMPGIDGVETLVRMKKLDSAVPVYMMTAFAVEDQIQRARQEGALGVIYKPIEIDKVLAMVEQFFGGGVPDAPANPA